MQTQRADREEIATIDLPTTAPDTGFGFLLNGELVRVENLSPNTTLLDWLRATGRTGAKQGCAEGDCGACTVALAACDAAGRPTWRAVNSCIALLPMVAGREVRTVEGIGKDEGGRMKDEGGERDTAIPAAKSAPHPPSCHLHPSQTAMVEHHGSQCGYCTPGFVMSMFEGGARGADLTERWQVADQLSGNLCRCTGYRPIADAATEVFSTAGGRSSSALPETPETPGLAYRTDGGEQFLRPSDLGELLRLRAANPEAHLIAGATELGLEVTKKFHRFVTLISVEGVAELREISRTPDAWTFGASATFTAIEEALRAAGNDAGPGAVAILKMLRVWGSRPIRNRATIGGNIANASPIGDLAPVLLALDARLQLVSEADGERELPLAEFFLAYRRTALRGDEILRAIVVPTPPAPTGESRRLVDCFKVSKRREMDISIVAGGFHVELDAAGTVTEARLAYGGVAATTLRALKTEAALVGQPWNRATLNAVLPILAAEFTPISDVRGSAEYRRGLITSLFEKFFVLDGSPEPETDPDRRPITAPDAPFQHPRQHESAVGHVTGRARYVDDMAPRRGTLEVWPVCAPHARAKILHRDASAARRMPGVHAVLLAEDVPGLNDVGAVRRDEVLLADTDVFFRGQLVALVVGESAELCRLAAAEVSVEYEPLTPILTVEEAIAAGSFHTDPHTMRRGDANAALATAPRTLSGELRMGGQEHFYLETHAAWAEPGEDGQTVFVQSSTQHPSEIQACVAHVLHLSRHQVVVECPRMGGGFGGKETQGNAFAALAALGARVTGRPVRVRLDRDQDMSLTGKRHPVQARWTVGFDDDGKLHALKAEVFANGGWSLDLSAAIADRALFHLDNAYYIPNFQATGRTVKTNIVSNTAFRGFGGPQGMLIIEDIMDHVARTLGLPPEVVRERNLYHGDGETNATHYGQSVGNNRLNRIWEELKATCGPSEVDGDLRASLLREAPDLVGQPSPVAEAHGNRDGRPTKLGGYAAPDGARRSPSTSAGIASRRAAIATWNAAHPHRKRGLAMTPVKFGISFTVTHLNQAGAHVLVYGDGSVQVNHGGTEMGQGLHTKMLTVAARALGLPPERVRVMFTRTDQVPNTSPTAASTGSDLNGAAVADACRVLRERLEPIARVLLAAEPPAETGKTPPAANGESPEMGATRPDPDEQSADGAAMQRGSFTAERDAHRLQDAADAMVDDDEAPPAGPLTFADGTVFDPARPEITVEWEKVIAAAYLQRVSLATTGYYATPGIHYDRETGRGNPFFYFACGAAVSEVEVDGFTGMHAVRRVDILHDVGESLNPGVDRGQVEGGFIQGMGWMTCEELRWDAGGRLLTHAPSTYKIPAFSDGPADFRVNFLTDAAQPGVIGGSKAVGEPPLMLAISVREALRDAVAAFGPVKGPVELPLPATCEAIFLAVREAAAGHREREGLNGVRDSGASGEQSQPVERH